MKTIELTLLAGLLLATHHLFSQTTNNLQAPTSVNDDGTAPDTSAMLDVQSTDKGMLVPRMSTVQREAIASPANGLLVFDTGEGNFFYHNGSQWQRLGLPTDGQEGEILKSDSTGQAFWQPLFDPALLPDPSNPVLSGSLSIGSFPKSVAVQDSFAYVVDAGSDDLKVIEVTDPANPVLSGSLAIGSIPQSVAVQDSFAYVVDSESDDFKVINVSDPSNPVLSGSLAIGSSLQSVAVQDSFAYVVDLDSDDLKVIDVSDPANPALSGSLTIGTAPTSVAIQGNHAYVMDEGSDELKIIDVSVPANPTLTGTFTIQDNPFQIGFPIAIQGDYAYVTDFSDGHLKVIDVSDPTTPVLSGSVDITGHFVVSLAVRGNYVYMVDSNFDDLKVVDVSDPANPVLSGSLAIGSSPQSVAVQGNFTYVVDSGSDDLKVILLGATILGLGLNGEPVAAVESDPQVGNNMLGYLPKWNGTALVQATAVFEDVTGNVGIGTNTPLSQLSLGSTLANTKLALYETSPTNNYGIGIQSGLFRFHTSNSFQRFGFFDGESSTANEVFTIRTNGNVGIGTNSPSQRLHVVGSICATGSIGACSDLRYKKDFRPISNALSSLTQLNGRYYHWKREAFPDKEFTEGRQIGLIAQEVQAVFPEMVLADNEGYLSVDYSRLTPVLVEAVKELSEQNEEQLSKIEKQQAEIKNLQAQLSEMSELKSELSVIRQALEQAGIAPE